MGRILERFSDIVKANVNAVLDKMEDPSKMIDQYLREMLEDLAEVKKETAGVMAEEARTKRLAEANAAEVAKYEELAKKALTAGNEDDARVFLSKKQELEAAVPDPSHKRCGSASFPVPFRFFCRPWQR